MASIIIGIDPGLTGALSKFEAGQLADIRDMPSTIVEKVSKGAELRDLIGGHESHKRREIDKAGLAALLRDWVANFSALIIREKVHTMPRQGIVSAGRFMEVVGIIDGVAAALGIPVETVEPQVWQRETNTPADEKGTCERARHIFPAWASYFKHHTVHHNRADAVMIGWYGVRNAQV
jgi:hypothetical protein